ncbi:MAG: acyl--CoA ligase [Acidimicrobiales bacterium]|nr:acyl--CoA ligase [Acidimicrobiales bacterium]MCB9372690.1 acyl--CoA ligase [Microthrixaceae bacterium]
MATTAEVRAQLTGPGGPFEVVTEQVGGIEMKVYKASMASLREVAAAAQARGNDQPFLVYGDLRLGPAEFVERANSVAHHLHDDFGVGHGDRVAVLSANNPEWCLSFWATVNLGAILVGLNGWWKTDEILYGLRDSGAKVLVADGRRFERIAEHLGDLPDLEAVFLVDAETDDEDDPRVHDFSVLAGDPTPALPDVPIDQDDPAVIFYTSGTTGKPKGAISTHRNMIANLMNTLFNGVLTGALAAAEAAEAGDEAGPAPGLGAGQTVSLFTSPLFHVSGCHSTLVVGLLAGLRLVMTEGKFEPEKALQLIEQEGVTIWATVPTMVWRVCEHPARHDYDTSTVTSVAFGGSPSADELQRMVRDTFPNVRTTSNVYGLTESSSAATIISGRDALEKPTSVGPPVPVVDLKIVDAEGTEVPTGHTGEVCLKGPIIMPGYWGKPEATAETVRDGWLHTGDLGHVDEDGYLFITDRAKDMIIRGGENIYCVEIEQRLVDHPAVADAAVIGVAHPELGEEVKAVVQVAPGGSITEDEVRRWVGEALATFKVPTYVELTGDKLPRNASGKLLKNVLRGEGEVSFSETM